MLLKSTYMKIIIPPLEQANRARAVTKIER